MNSVLPALAGEEENLLRVNSIWSQMDSVSFVLGPALGGILALLGAPQLAFLINGITFLVSAGTLLLVRIPPRTAPEEKEGGEEEGPITTGAQGEPVEPLDGDSGTDAQGGPDAEVESGSDSGPGFDILDGGDSNGAGLQPVAAVLGARADSLPLTGLGLGALFLMGLLLLGSGIAVRRGSGATG